MQTFQNYSLQFGVQLSHFKNMVFKVLKNKSISKFDEIFFSI